MQNAKYKRVFNFAFCILNFALMTFRHKIILPAGATNFWREFIINTTKNLHSESNISGAAMDLNAPAVIADEDVFQGDESIGVAFVAPVQENFDAVEPTEKDFALARKAAEGNVAAFELIYNRYHRRTYSLCLRMMNSPTEAEDLTQEVFIQLFRKIGSFRGDAAFSTWLHRMTVNQVLMHFRRRGVQNEKTTDDGEMPEQIVNGTENQNRMPILDRIALNKAIAQLPNGYRTVFILHDVEGFEHEEIARMLKLSVGTSKSQLHKARLKLRGLLRKQIGSA